MLCISTVILAYNVEYPDTNFEVRAIDIPCTQFSSALTSFAQVCVGFECQVTWEVYKNNKVLSIFFDGAYYDASSEFLIL